MSQFTITCCKTSLARVSYISIRICSSRCSVLDLFFNVWTYNSITFFETDYHQESNTSSILKKSSLKIIISKAHSFVCFFHYQRSRNYRYCMKLYEWFSSNRSNMIQFVCVFSSCLNTLFCSCTTTITEKSLKWEGSCYKNDGHSVKYVLICGFIPLL